MGEYRAALAIDPNYAFAEVNLGAALDDLKDRKGARVALEKAVRMAPQSKEAWNNLGAVAAEMGDTPRALEALGQGHRARRQLHRRLVQLRHDLRAGGQAQGRRGRVGQVRLARPQERLDRHREAASGPSAIVYNHAVRVSVVVLLALVATPLRAEPQVRLRFATIAPEGTGWAREVKAFAREIESESDGRISLHAYLGGIAGDDAEMGRRMRQDQLDGALSAGMLCQEVVPSFAIYRIPGLMQSRDEVNYVTTRLFPRMQKEARAHGMVLLTSGSLGSDVVLSRVPIDSMETLRSLRLWQWDLDRTSIAVARAMGLHSVPLPVAEAGRAYEEGRTDGLHRHPERHLRLSVVLAAAVHVAAAVRAAARLRAGDGGGLGSPAAGSARDRRRRRPSSSACASARPRWRRTSELLGGLFEKQGMRSVPVSPLLRAQFLDAAHVGARPARRCAGVRPTCC